MLIYTIVAALFALMGLAAFIAPQELLRRLDLPATTATARNEVQAVYGGFGIAMAVVLLLPYEFPALRNGIGCTVASALAGMAAGRVIAALREGITRWPLLFFTLEALGAAALFAAAAV
jgi:uncharacterized membrane protein